jgi:hypothetical protein
MTWLPSVWLFPPEFGRYTPRLFCGPCGRSATEQQKYLRKVDIKWPVLLISLPWVLLPRPARDIRSSLLVTPPGRVTAKSASAAADQQSADRRASCHSADPLSGKASLPTARHIRVPAIPARGLYPPAAPRPTPYILSWGSAHVTHAASGHFRGVQTPANLLAGKPLACRRRLPAWRRRKGFYHLLRGPSGRRMLGHIEVNDAPAIMLPPTGPDF